MSLIPTVYSSTDAGAPALTGQAGSMLALLRALLVTGFGTAPNAKPGLGWTEEFAGTNKAVFRNNPTSGSGYRLRIDDTQVRVARIRAYTTMTTVDAGAGITPTTTQRTNGSLWPKSATTDSAARAWWAIGNERCFYLFVAPSPNYPTIAEATVYFAGDLLSLKPSDAHRFAVSTMSLNAYDGADATETSNLFFGAGLTVQSTPTASAAHLFIARAAAGTGAAVPAHIINDRGTGAVLGGAGFTYPYPLSNGMLWERAIASEGSMLIRGFMPGIIFPLHATPFADLQALNNLVGMPSGASYLAKRFVALAPGYAASYPGQVLFDLGPWT